MKNPFTRFLAVIIVIFTLPTSIALPEDLHANFYYNPLLLNGQSVSFERLATASRGVISLVKGNPQSPEAPKVPFRIYLVRSGNIVDANAHARNHAVTEYELGKILSYAHVDDQIVIDPINKSDGAGRRILTVGRIQVMPQFNWLTGLIKTGDGC